MTQQRYSFDFYPLAHDAKYKEQNVAKECFLRNLKGKSSHYKRYTKSPLRHGGGKSLAVGLILEH
ncbi:hypothetical protein [Helicobacter sp. UBA3407]|uniref:hypothetical protein n=1 Tax=Helicobacter TaxID=209 RepID=UPI002624BDD1|nr:hypothetical protein [Helicobacter sp. UBA3407]